MANNTSRFEENRFVSAEGDFDRLPHRTIIMMMDANIEGFVFGFSHSLILLACTVVTSCLWWLNPPALSAAEPLSLEALMELDPLDWSSIHPRAVADECTLALSGKTKLTQDQVCQLYLLRGSALILLGKEEAATRDLTELLNIHAKNPLALRIRGEAYSALRKYDKAQADFESLVKLQPNAGLSHACLARCLSEIGHRDESAKLAERAITLDPDEPLGYLARAEVFISDNKYRDGIKDLNRCISLSYGNGTIIAARPFLLRAIVFMSIFDNPRKALPDLLMARGLDRYADDTKCLFSEYYFKAGKYKMAYCLSEQFPKIEPNRLNMLNAKVNCLIERKRYNDAQELSASIVRQVPRWWAGYLTRGEVSFAQQKYKDALSDYNQSLILRPDNLGTMAAKAYLYATCPDSHFRDGPSARTLATKCCVRTEYQVPRQLMLLAMAAAECGDYKEAERWANRALEKADSRFPFLDDYRQRLALFEKGMPYRFTPDSRGFDYLFP